MAALGARAGIVIDGRHRPTCFVDTMHLKHILGIVQSNHSNCHVPPSFVSRVRSSDHTRCRGSGAVHSIITAPDRAATYQIAFASTGSSTHDAWHPRWRSARGQHSPLSDACWAPEAGVQGLARMSEGLHLAAADAVAVATLELGVSPVGRRPPPARDSRQSLPPR